MSKGALSGTWLRSTSSLLRCLVNLIGLLFPVVRLQLPSVGAFVQAMDYILPLVHMLSISSALTRCRAQLVLCRYVQSIPPISIDNFNHRIVFVWGSWYYVVAHGKPRCRDRI